MERGRAVEDGLGRLQQRAGVERRPSACAEQQRCGRDHGEAAQSRDDIPSDGPRYRGRV